MAPPPPWRRAAPYICVSYSWGVERTANPFYSGQSMSIRALPALKATHAALAAFEATPDEMRLRVVWLDAACVPPQDPAHTLCLRNMGAIYAAARAVLAVMSP